MKSSWFSILLVAGLLVMLGVLAWLQYVWLGQISDAERERLQRVVRSDTERFTEDFNREIQNAYFNFQTSADLWRAANWNEFNERYRFWRSKTAYQDLIKNIYFTEAGENKPLFRYNPEKGEFAPADWTDKIAPVKPQIAAENNPQTIFDEIPALILPVHDAPVKVNQVFVRTPKREEEVEKIPAQVEIPKRYGVLIVELDGEVIKNRILPELATKYFGENEGGAFKLAVTNRSNQTVFQTGQISASDTSAKLFNLSPENFVFFANRELIPKIQGEKRTMTLSTSTIQTRTEKKTSENENRFDVKVLKREEPPRVRIFEGESLQGDGVWTLSVQHSAGSLEQFITNTRRKNLAISFGILGLLGVSILLIFVSSQRAKRFAQRQIDFVSSVSHEFRTPLAVIYSAGENLADGVAREERQVSLYGNLIKNEGRKLSNMVEQILAFAGANSGRKKYDFREQDVKNIIESAIDESRTLIDEKGFIVETDLPENLPAVKADANALIQALQNLIGNALKYSNGEKWLKISAKNGGGRVKITVEDKGIGIAPKDLKHIFEPFYRAKAVVDEQIHGNGLGLSLVRETVEAHGGKISAESEIGKGSRFTIELPQVN